MFLAEVIYIIFLLSCVYKDFLSLITQVKDQIAVYDRQDRLYKYDTGQVCFWEALAMCPLKAFLVF